MNEFSSNESIQPQNLSPVTGVTAEEVRKKHINHEASVKSIGTLYYLGAILMIIAGICTAFSHEEIAPAGRFFVVAFLIGLSIFQIWVGRGLRKLKSWARIVTGIWSGIGLLGFPLGTLVNAYILYLILCKKGSTVFSSDYKQVIAATPHIKYKTHILIWIFLLILITFLLLGIVAILFAKK
jgi:hypothetical protein